MARVGSSNVGIRPMLCLINLLLYIPRLWLDFGRISPGCSTPSEYDLALFWRAFSTRYLRSLFRQWFDVTDNGIIGPSCGYKFNMNVCRTRYLHSRGLFYIDFYVLVLSEGYFICLCNFMVTSAIYKLNSTFWLFYNNLS